MQIVPWLNAVLSMHGLGRSVQTDMTGADRTCRLIDHVDIDPIA